MISLTMSSFFAERGVVVGVGWLLRSMNATQRFFIQQQAVSATRRIYSVDNDHLTSASQMLCITQISK